MTKTIKTMESDKTTKTLLCVLGFSPAILTETLYALVHQEQPFIPDKIEVITTKPGAKQSKLALFKDNGGRFHNFCQEYNIEGINFSEDDIFCIKDANGNLLDDIRDEEDNSAVANLITKRVQYHTQQNSILHVSLAGGRKTMGYYAGYALSIFGRRSDRLSHVLVQEEFEGLRDFFYPTKSSCIISSRKDDVLLNCKDAKVELANIPFIRLRKMLNDEFTKIEKTFSELVDFVDNEVSGVPSVTLIRESKTLQVNNQDIKLKLIDFAFYDWIATRTKADSSWSINVPLNNDLNTEEHQSLVNFLSKGGYEMSIQNRTLEKLEKGISKQFFDDRRNSLTKNLKEHLGEKTKVYDLFFDADKKNRKRAGVLSLKINPSELFWK